MRVISASADMRIACRESLRPLGLVPTMGALHAGHLSLVDHARANDATVAVSIFVNPAQFGPGEDFEDYPRDLERDLVLLREHGVDLVFAPDVTEVYPQGFETSVDVGPLAGLLEGAVRPGHFRGVATVVTKLFNVTRPDHAYFGQKDGQQTIVVRRMVRDLDMGVNVVVLPTVREADGLAMSSRNARLSASGRRAAAVVYQALLAARSEWETGTVDANRLREAARRVLDGEPLVEGIDYVSVSDENTLQELEEISGPAMVSAAVRIGGVRIIDNVMLG